MTDNEVILKVGGSGGSVALYGLRSGAGWLFSLDFIDQAALSSAKSTLVGVNDVVNSWPDALVILDKYPWHRLVPLMVHPEFRVLVFNEYKTRYKKLDSDANGQRERWERLCSQVTGIETDDELAKYVTKTPVHSSDTWLYESADEETPLSEEDHDYVRDELIKLGLDEEEATSMLTDKKK